jgi:glycosyltransferase involved in cell wall biosynthesis
MKALPELEPTPTFATRTRRAGEPLPPRVLFVGTLFAGHRTRFMNLRAHSIDDPRIRPEYAVVSGWNEGGVIERLGFLPRTIRGRVRAVAEARSLARMPRPDVIWTSAGGRLLTAYAWAQIGPLRRPLVFDTDSSPRQWLQDAELYLGRHQRSGLRQRRWWAGVTSFIASSRWAAAGLERDGIPADSIQVISPGVDLDLWRFPERRPRSPLRLLFVGADFERKGGPLLLDVVGSRFRGRIELDVVTHARQAGSPGVRFHRAEPNSPELRSLFARADLFVLPTRADCFGIAVVEAMASGLPVVMGDVGAAREIIEEGDTGWVIPHDGSAMAEVLETALRSPERLPQMGRRARQVAEERYDGLRNDRRIVDVLVHQHERRLQLREQMKK